MTSNSKAVCGGGELEAAARELLAHAYEECVGEGPYATYADLARRGSGSFTLCSIRAVTRALQSAALASTAGAGAGDWVTVPRELTTEMIQAAEHAKIGGTPCTMVDWVEGYSRQDVEDIGVIWPESPWDRGSIVTEDVHAILLKTWWAAMLSAVPASPRSGAGEKVDQALLRELSDLADWLERDSSENDADNVRAAVSALSQGGGAGRSERAVEIRELFAEIIHDHTHREQGIISWAELRKQNWLHGIAGQKARTLADKLIAALHRSEIAGRSEKGEGDSIERVRSPHAELIADGLARQDPAPHAAPPATGTWKTLTVSACPKNTAPCHWGGGNDIIWCSTCGAQYAYAKGEERPPCPRSAAPAQSPSTSDREG